MDTLGLIECRSIAAGSACLDIMLKAANVELLKAGTICPGKYMIYILGDRESVRMSITSASTQEIKIVGSAVIANVSPELIAVISNKSLVKLSNISALGVIETQTLTSTLEIADALIKAVDVKLSRLVLAQGIAGKAYFVLCGDLASIQEAVHLTKTNFSEKLVDAVAIARPEQAVIKTLIGGVK